MWRCVDYLYKNALDDPTLFQSSGSHYKVRLLEACQAGFRRAFQHSSQKDVDTITDLTKRTPMILTGTCWNSFFKGSSSHVLCSLVKVCVHDKGNSCLDMNTSCTCVPGSVPWTSLCSVLHSKMTCRATWFLCGCCKTGVFSYYSYISPQGLWTIFNETGKVCTKLHVSVRDDIFELHEPPSELANCLRLPCYCVAIGTSL